MATLYVCDWCGDQYSDREAVASVDLTIGATNEKLHICEGCSPEWIRDRFPDDTDPVTDGVAMTDGGDDIGDGTEPVEPPHVTVGDRVALCAKHDGENEYVHGVVNEVHSPKTIDVLYRVESRASNGGEGRFRRDSHTDTYDFATSCVYMADSNGWLKGWDDA